MSNEVGLVQLVGFELCVCVRACVRARFICIPFSFFENRDNYSARPSHSFLLLFFFLDF